MQDRKPRTRVHTEVERHVGRTDPPRFAFEPLRVVAAARVLGPAGLSHKLVTIVAPVGYGKTVFMSILQDDLRRSGKRCLWLTLDERDTRVDAVISGLGQQIQARRDRLDPTQVLMGGDEPVEQRIEQLVERLNRPSLPLTLFIDNLHFCADPALAPLLDRLCFATRSTVQLVLSSTRELPLNVSRALLEGLILPLGPAELGFGPEQISALFGRELCSRIGEEGIAQVTRQTEGWPAAARMAQIVLSGSAQPQQALASFAGSDQGLAHLLHSKVLSGFTPEARDFLRMLGLLRSFTPDLCREASRHPQAAEYLDDLIRRNVFIIPLDRNQQWFRLHTLFRDYLLHEAERELDESVRRDVLQRAAHWCEQHGYWREAVDYALSARACATASAMLERIAASFVRDHGEVRQYIDWMETLHRLGPFAGPEAEYWFAWALAFYRRYDDARRHIRRLAQHLDHPPVAAGADRADSELRRRIDILQISIDCLTDHFADAYAGADRWLAEAGSDDGPFALTAAYCIQSAAHAGSFRFVESRRSILQARESAFQAQSAYVDGWVAAYAGLAPIYEGSYAGAYAELLEALEAARATLGEDGGIVGNLALIAAKCAVEMGLDAEARELLRQGLRTLRTHGFLEAADCGLDAALQVWNGSDDELLSLAGLRTIASAYPSRLSQMFSCHLIRRWLALGRREEAREEAERIGLGQRREPLPADSSTARPIPYTRDLRTLTELDLSVDAGRLKQAEQWVEAEIARSRKDGRVARVVELSLRQAQFACSGGVETSVMRPLLQAVRLAAPRRILRPFLAHAQMLSRLLGQTGTSAWGFATGEEQRFFADVCARLPTAGDRDKRAEAFSEPRLLGTLTRRELDMLHLIEAGLSNQQIADQLEVSLTTIKWHLQNLYAKLDVSSRSAALARAKASQLLRR